MESVAIVSGGGNGIGAAIAMSLAQDLRYNVVVCDIDKAAAEAVASDISKLGVKSLAVQCDVTKSDEVNRMVEESKTLGDLVALVNNAGITRDSQCIKMSDADWDLVMDVNLKSMFLTSRAVCQHWAAVAKELAAAAGQARPPPMFYPKRRIVNISSIVAKGGNFGQVNYVSSKAGALGLTKTLAKEMARYNVNVNAIQPGFIKTRMTEDMPEKVLDKIAASIPLGEMGSPQAIANTVKFLASDQAAYVTGTSIIVDGGV